MASAKNESCIIIGLVKRFGGKPVDVIAVLQNGEVAAYLPAAGYGRLQSADPVTGYYREQERPGSPLRGWDTLFGCGELALLRLPLPSKRPAAAPAAPCEDRLSGGAGPLL